MIYMHQPTIRAAFTPIEKMCVMSWILGATPKARILAKGPMMPSSTMALLGQPHSTPPNPNPDFSPCESTNSFTTSNPPPHAVWTPRTSVGRLTETIPVTSGS
uniref:Uncharacterized protein n=1 Tax=Compsopogon caeruleus TaxID=31354 RepID=A0A7S1T732_9RHOD